MIAIDLNKQHPLNAYSKAMQQINFTVNLKRVGNTQMFFIPERSRKLSWIFRKILCIENAFYEYHLLLTKITKYCSEDVKLKFTTKNTTNQKFNCPK